MSWEPIVVGVDASPESAAAVAFAMRAAERAGTHCHLVHATRDVLAVPDAPEGNRYRQAVVEQARAQLVTALRDALPAQLLATLVVRLGGAPGVLETFAADVGAGLIVLGGKQHSMLGRWLGGSTSLDVIRTTDVPVLVTAGLPDGLRRVLVAVDVSGAARPTLAAAERYAAMFGAELRALSVLEPLPVIPEVTPPYDTTQYYTMSEQLLAQDVWPAIRTPEVEKIMRHGMAVETILREVTDWRADLLVVGSHGKGWAERMLVGSVTERLLNHLPTSLLVVPTRAAAVVTDRPREVAAAQPTVAIA